jgi:hypothetical protein
VPRVLLEKIGADKYVNNEQINSSSHKKQGMSSTKRVNKTMHEKHASQPFEQIPLV